MKINKTNYPSVHECMGYARIDFELERKEQYTLNNITPEALKKLDEALEKMGVFNRNALMTGKLDDSNAIARSYGIKKENELFNAWVQTNFD